LTKLPADCDCPIPVADGIGDLRRIGNVREHDDRCALIAKAEVTAFCRLNEVRERIVFGTGKILVGISH